jgi:hypothetical protein
MDTAVKGIARPDQYVGGCAQIPKQAVRALSAPIRGFVRLGHDHHDVVVAVSPPVAPCARSKKIDALRLARVNQALNNFPEKWVLALRFDHPAHPPVSIHPNPWRSARSPPAAPAAPLPSRSFRISWQLSGALAYVQILN